jgi:hypothetical protein
LDQIDHFSNDLINPERYIKCFVECCLKKTGKLNLKIWVNNVFYAQLFFGHVPAFTYLTKMKRGLKIDRFYQWQIYFMSSLVNKESFLSRVINPNAPGKERNKLKRATALALRVLMKETEINSKTQDLIAFIVLALEGIDRTVNTTTTAWEKRDYWIKADRFRLEWEWASRLGSELRGTVLSEDWEDVPSIAIQIFQYVGDEKISKNHRMGQPWIGAWNKLNQK